MRLSPLERCLVQRGRCQPLIDITVEGEHRLLGIGWRERGVPLLVTGHIERSKLVRQTHQPRDLGGAAFAQDLDQLLRLVQKCRLGERFGCRRSIVIERLCGRKNNQHGNP